MRQSTDRVLSARAGRRELCNPNAITERHSLLGGNLLDYGASGVENALFGLHYLSGSKVALVTDEASCCS